mmetsp:Transcript_5170/g.10512  ORF Transcript_5170/g.10512 Transcript_5170/m.10512 type:complete len:221 (+) Transcript_5170:216-878(+)
MSASSREVCLNPSRRAAVDCKAWVFTSQQHGVSVQNGLGKAVWIATRSPHAPHVLFQSAPGHLRVAQQGLLFLASTPHITRADSRGNIYDAARRLHQRQESITDPLHAIDVDLQDLIQIPSGNTSVVHDSPDCRSAKRGPHHVSGMPHRSITGHVKLQEVKPTFCTGHFSQELPCSGVAPHFVACTKEDGNVGARLQKLLAHGKAYAFVGTRHQHPARAT